MLNTGEFGRDTLMLEPVVVVHDKDVVTRLIGKPSWPPVSFVRLDYARK